ncbi:DUF1772 domain-containing protein [Rhodovastum atsumiense]|uniref:DUF1772 domain-containing protein n=1 Tax=Rhodovastum atsumiense TaxID=504468 RepID=A0A5M6IZR0_9PROT|nr:DUF1772 domain-containing protein [Rhodovastum atsumiense]KAA5613317.1 DUF1772 domain-containing protein [Rhodovastum atsumiense]
MSRQHAITIALTALALGPALAHALELPNKIGLSREAYLLVQQIYHGWALLGIVVILQILLCGVLAWRLRGRIGGSLVLIAFLCAAGTQVVFWGWTYPANAATAQWTMLPEGWEALRAQWEYSHAAGAGLNLAALGFLLAAAVIRH